MALGQGYNPAATGAPRPEAQDFIPGSNYYNMTNAHMQDAFLGYVDPNVLNAPNGSCAPPAAMMLPPAQPVVAREPPFTRDITAGLHDRHRARTEYASASAVGMEADGRGAPQPPPPPALSNVDDLRCPSPSLYQLRSDVEATHDRLARIGTRVDSLERRQNEIVAFCESFSSWSHNVLTCCEKLNKKIDAVEVKLQQGTGEKLSDNVV